MFLETRVTKVGTHLLIVTPMQLYCKPAAAALDYGHHNHYNHGLVFVLMQSPLLCSDHLVPVSTTLTTLTLGVMLQVKMQPPRDVFELAEAVEVRDDAEMEQSVRRAMWISAFLAAPKMKCSPERTELFYFLVYCSALSKVPESDLTRTKKILENIRIRFFSDSEFWRPSISLSDIHNVVDVIFR